LRRKLSDLANHGVSIEAVPGLGYRLSIKGA
jgi:DNA-binding response OmpR family regulator